MSDSILDLSNCGTEDIFRLKPDWSSRPSMNLSQFGREIIQYDKAAMKYRPLTANIGIDITFNFFNVTKSDEYDLLNFFHLHKAMCNKFWLPVPWNYFGALGKDITIGDTDIELLNDMGFVNIFRGVERFYMILANGDFITRQLFYAVNPEGKIYGVFSPMAHDISKDDKITFGKLILCRFDQDDLTMSHDTTHLSKCSIKFKELGQETVSEEA